MVAMAGSVWACTGVPRTGAASTVIFTPCSLTAESGFVGLPSCANTGAAIRHVRLTM